MTAKLLRALLFLLTPLWVTTFRDPVQSGRLRLDGLSRGERQLARAGLVTLLLLLGSLLFTEVWRRGDLVALQSDDPVLVPDGLVPVTLVATCLAIALVVWGALDASPLVRIGVAAVYATTVVSLSLPGAIAADDVWILQHGETVLSVAFWTPFAALVLSAVLSLLPGRARGWTRWATPTFRVLTLLALGALAGTHLRMGVAAADLGFQGNVQTWLHTAFSTIDGLLVPLTFIAAVAVVDFATDVSSSIAEPVRSASARWLRVLAAALLGVIAVKLWSALWQHRDYWSTLLANQPLSIVRTMAAVLLIGGLAAYLLRTVPPGPDSAVDEAKERLTLAGAAVLSLVILGQVVLLGFAQLVVKLTRDDWGFVPSRHYPFDTLNDAVPIVASVLAILGGARLVRSGSRRLGPARSRELGTGLLLLGVWNLPAWIDAATDYSWGFSYPVVDLAVTLAVVGWLLVRWRRLDLAEVSLLLAVVVFSWLVISRGDYISYAGGLLGLPVVVVVVFGILYTLASGAGFTTESSPRLPREARTLMFVGYLLLSVTILNWLEVIHEPGLDLGTTAFYFVGLPLAVWLLVRRIVPRQLTAPALEPDPAPSA